MRVLWLLALALSWFAFACVVNAGDRITITSADGRKVVIEEGKAPVWLKPELQAVPMAPAYAPAEKRFRIVEEYTPPPVVLESPPVIVRPAAVVRPPVILAYPTVYADPIVERYALSVAPVEIHRGPLGIRSYVRYSDGRVVRYGFIGARTVN